MVKCDTQKQATKIDGELWCHRCCRDCFHSEEELPNVMCRECMVIHLKERCFEKISGWLCRSCAKKYDEQLLKEMTAVKP